MNTLPRNQKSVDNTDKRIIDALQRNCNLPLDQVAKDLEVPKATLHYRIRRLEQRGIIEGYHAKIDPSAVGKDFVTITFIHTKYDPQNFAKIGKKLSQIEGVCAVYFIFGKIDFIVIARSNNSKDYLRKIEEIQKLEGILSTSTHIVAKVFKENGGIDLESDPKKMISSDSQKV